MDFTYPFWVESLGVLVKKIEDSNVTDTIFQPLHYWVWVSLFGAMVFVSLIMWLADKLVKKDPVSRDFASCWWYTISSFLLQGMDSVNH